MTKRFYAVTILSVFLRLLKSSAETMHTFAETRQLTTMNDITLSFQQEPRYACILFDSTFKAVICTPENEDLLIEIIELLIPGKHISHITFLNTEKHGFVVSEKSVTFDLLCKDENTGEEFRVEVQNSDKKSCRDRELA